MQRIQRNSPTFSPNTPPTQCPIEFRDLLGTHFEVTKKSLGLKGPILAKKSLLGTWVPLKGTHLGTVILYTNSILSTHLFTNLVENHL